MALPTNTTPIYTTIIPSTKKEFKYRPFFVREEKSLLIAQQSEDTGVMLDTIRDVIKACAKSNVDIDKLASFDIEYLFLQLRSSSVGEMIELIFACDTDHGADNEKALSRVAINLQDVKVQFSDNHTAKIPLFENVGVMMKYPSVETLKKIETTDISDTDALFDIVADCIDFIYDSDQIYSAKEQKKEELLEFLNNLTSQQFDLIQNFFRTMPQLRVDINYTCPICSKEHNKYMEGLASFF